LKTKKKLKREARGRGLVVIFVLTSLAILLIGFLNPGKKPEQKPDTEVKIEWKTGPSVEKAYPSPTNDIVGHTLDNLHQLYDFLANKAAGDTNLLRLIAQEQSVALTRDQLDADLSKLAGKEIGYIGQFHESMDSGDMPISSIQARIKKQVEEQYDVMWTEDFVDGEVMNAENSWKQFVRESAESDIPFVLSSNNEAYTKAYMVKSTPLHASYQFIFDANSKIEVRGADYRPLKAVQQHLMSYRIPPQVRGKPVPCSFSKDEQFSIVNTIGSTRNLYILRTMALHADWSKRNVIVLGASHTEHIAYVMAKYGVKCTPVYPVTKDN
jgi:hypothetical protein